MKNPGLSKLQIEALEILNNIGGWMSANYLMAYGIQFSTVQALEKRGFAETRKASFQGNNFSEARSIKQNILSDEFLRWIAECIIIAANIPLCPGNYNWNIKDEGFIALWGKKYNQGMTAYDAVSSVFLAN